MKTTSGAIVVASGLAITLIACSSAQPSVGKYTVEFPSTAAAIATDYVQVLVFDVNGQNKTSICEDLITQRETSPDSLTPSVNPPAPAANICEMRAGTKSVAIPYGDHALLAIGERKQSNAATTDFLIGCAIMNIGDGDAPVPIPLRLVSVNSPVPSTTCASVADFCSEKCNN